MPDTATQAKTRRRREVASGVVYGFLAVFLLLLLYVVAQTYSLLTVVRETQKSSRDAVFAIEDCTTLGGRCFEESQQRTGEAVSTIGRYDLYTAWCIDQPGSMTLDRLERCAMRLARTEATVEPADR